MDFDAWQRSGVDSARIKRLLVGYVVGALAISFGMAFIVLTSKGAAAIEEEEPAIEAQLVTAPEPEPEPEPPAPEPEPEKPRPKPARVATPVEIPKEAPRESDAQPPLPTEEDPFEEKTPEPAASAAPALVEAPKPPPPRKQTPRGPIRVTENVTPPVAVAQPQPELPASAKAAGIDGVVIVKYVVTETGQVSDAQVVKGPAELHAACLAAVRNWRFKPALLEGKPVSVVRLQRFRFRIKT